MVGVRDLGVVEIGENLGDNSVHYSGFGILSELMSDQKISEDKKKEAHSEVPLDDRVQLRAQEAALAEARLPGVRLEDDRLQGEENLEESLEQGEMNISRPEEMLEQAEKTERKIQAEMVVSQVDDMNKEEKVVEMFVDNLDLLPFEVEVREDIMEQSMVYEGYVKGEGVYQGEGRLLFKNGDTYEGDWVEGAMEGKGVMRYADGGIYEGRWRCGLREGMGEIVFHNGDYYRGQWAADNMTDGFGKFTYPDGTVYLGEIVGGSTMGKGRITFPLDAEDDWTEEDLKELERSHNLVLERPHNLDLERSSYLELARVHNSLLERSHNLDLEKSHHLDLEKSPYLAFERSNNLAQLEKTKEDSPPSKKFKFYFCSLVVVLVIVALALIAVFAWWLVFDV